MPLISLSEIAAGSTEGNTLQLLVDKFAPRYDADTRLYLQLQILRLMSGALKDTR